MDVKNIFFNKGILERWFNRFEYKLDLVLIKTVMKISIE